MRFRGERDYNGCAQTYIRVRWRVKSQKTKRVVPVETDGIIIRRRETNPSLESLESRETQGDDATRRSSYLQFEQSSSIVTQTPTSCA